MKSSKKRLIFFTQEYSSYLTKRKNVYEIINKLTDYYDVIVISLRSENPSYQDNLGHYIVQRSNKFYTVLQILRVLWDIRTKGITCFFHQGGVYPIIVAPFKIVYNWKLIQWKAHPALDISTIAFILRIVDKVLTVSPSSYPIISNRISYIGHGISKVFTNKPTSLKDLKSFQNTQNTLHGVVCGRLTKSKGIHLILDFLDQLANKFSAGKIKFHFYGLFHSPNYKKKIEARIKSINKKNKNLFIQYFGFVDQNNVAALYRKADFSINLSSTALDKALLEALSCGCLTFSNNINLMETVLSQNIKDWIYSDHIDIFVERLIYLSKNREFFYSLTHEISTEIKSYYNMNNYVKRIINEL